MRLTPGTRRRRSDGQGLSRRVDRITRLLHHVCDIIEEKTRDQRSDRRNQKGKADERANARQNGDNGLKPGKGKNEKKAEHCLQSDPDGN